MSTNQASNIKEQIIKDTESLSQKGRIELLALLGQVCSYWSLAKGIDLTSIASSKEREITEINVTTAITPK